MKKKKQFKSKPVGSVQKIVINSQSTGKFHTEVINNRPHLVTEMVSIVGDSVMNGLFYPLGEIQNTFTQLDSLPAPAGHPVINGVNVSAFHPLAINAFHIGGFVRNPRMVGNKVVNELVIDVEVANADDRGQKIVEKIEASEAIGVSTGLNASVRKEEGKIGNSAYKGVVSGIKFDHVAPLLDEAPAGDQTFTINKDLTVCNVADSVNELMEQVRDAAQEKFETDKDKYIWVLDVLVSPTRAIVEIGSTLFEIPFGYDDSGDVVFTSEGVEVERQVSFVPVGNSASITNSEVSEMDIEKLVLAIIGNSANGYTMADKGMLMSMAAESDLVSAIHNKLVSPELTVEAAQAVLEEAGMTINSADFDKESYDLFVANAEGFKAYMASKSEERNGLVEKVLANSKMTKEQVEAMSDEGIQNLANSLMPNQDFSVGAQTINNNDREPAGNVELHEEA